VSWTLVGLVALLVAQAVWQARRMRLVAQAEHELRGPLQSIALAAPERCGEDIERARIALADLALARTGRRARREAEVVRLDRVVWRAAAGWDLAARRAGGGVHLDWKAGPISIRADRGRLAQAIGNLLANAVEHGGGEVRVIGRRTGRGIRLEVRDSGRGHGLAIAARAVRDSGGQMSATRAGSGTAVAIDLPIESDPADGCLNAPHVAADPAAVLDPPGVAADPAAAPLDPAA
jgi:signal transduction histidine kinase